MGPVAEKIHSWEFVVHDLGTLSYDGYTVDASANLEPGTFLGVVTATGIAKPYDWSGAATDGTQKLAGILGKRVIAAGAGKTVRRVLLDALAEVSLGDGRVVIPAGHTAADAKAALKTIGIKVRADYGADEAYTYSYGA